VRRGAEVGGRPSAPYRGAPAEEPPPREHRDKGTPYGSDRDLDALRKHCGHLQAQVNRLKAEESTGSGGEQLEAAKRRIKELEGQ